MSYWRYAKTAKINNQLICKNILFYRGQEYLHPKAQISVKLEREKNQPKSLKFNGYVPVVYLSFLKGPSINSSESISQHGPQPQV
jgi:hypothetical protein